MPLKRGGFSLLEVLLAVAILALLASLSLPRLQRPTRNMLMLGAQTELAEVGYQVGLMAHIHRAETEQIEAALPDYLYVERTEPLYQLRYIRRPETNNWWLLATPLANSPVADGPSLIMDSAGRCWHDKDANATVSPEDRPCGRR